MSRVLIRVSTSAKAKTSTDLSNELKEIDKQIEEVQSQLDSLTAQRDGLQKSLLILNKKQVLTSRKHLISVLKPLFSEKGIKLKLVKINFRGGDVERIVLPPSDKYKTVVIDSVAGSDKGGTFTVFGHKKTTPGNPLEVQPIKQLINVKPNEAGIDKVIKIIYNR